MVELSKYYASLQGQKLFPTLLLRKVTFLVKQLSLGPRVCHFWRYWKMVIIKSIWFRLKSQYLHASCLHIDFSQLMLFLGQLEGIPALTSSLDPTKKEFFLKRCEAGSGDLILFAVGPASSVNKTLDRLRMYVANILGLVDNVSSYCNTFWLILFRNVIYIYVFICAV